MPGLPLRHPSYLGIASGPDDVPVGKDGPQVIGTSALSSAQSTGRSRASIARAVGSRSYES